MDQRLALFRTGLRYFDEAIRHGSIRKAADSLHVASSAVNRQLLQLEGEMGTRLFERMPRGIRATAAGELLLGYFRRWNREVAALRQEMGGLRGGVRGTIRIAASESLTAELLPNAMHELQVQFPLIDFSLISGDNYRITSELFARDADVGLAYDVSEDVRARFVQTVTSPIGVVSTPDHPIAALREATLADCAEHPLVIPGRDWLMHSGLAAVLRDTAMPGRVVARAERPGMLKALVRAGIGIGFLVPVGLERDIADGTLAWTPLRKGIIGPATISLMVPRGRLTPAHTAAFVEILKRELLALAR